MYKTYSALKLRASPRAFSPEVVSLSLPLAFIQILLRIGLHTRDLTVFVVKYRTSEVSKLFDILKLVWLLLRTRLKFC